jgi:hypothetical protein
MQFVRKLFNRYGNPESAKSLNITVDIDYDINNKMKCEKTCSKTIQIGDLDI